MKMNTRSRSTVDLHDAVIFIRVRRDTLSRDWRNFRFRRDSGNVQLRATGFPVRIKILVIFRRDKPARNRLRRGFPATSKTLYFPAFPAAFQVISTKIFGYFNQFYPLLVFYFLPSKYLCLSFYWAHFVISYAHCVAQTCFKLPFQTE